jgi:acetyl-CoA acyltransferase
MAVLLAGLPPTVPGVTVNRLCGSGGEAIVQAARAIRAGDADTVIAGGVESMSRAPFVMPKPDVGFPTDAKLFHTQVGWRMVNPRFPDTWTASLGSCAEAVAAELGIGRLEQDEWSLRSHRLAGQAWDAGLHDDYVLPVEDVKRDESIRADTTAEKLARLKPAFSRDGAVTAGNSSPINDGAIAVLVGSQSTVDTLGAAPFGRVVASATVGVEPQHFSIAPVGAIRKVLDRAGLSFADIAVWEINEAFAAMVLSCLHKLPEIDRDKVNPHGGAIAIGHPLGMSGARLVVTLLHELRRRRGRYGLATMCVGVGQGQAALFEGASG